MQIYIFFVTNQQVDWKNALFKKFFVSLSPI